MRKQNIFHVGLCWDSASYETKRIKTFFVNTSAADFVITKYI